MEGILECNQISNPTGQAPRKIGCAGAHFHWASLGITGHCGHPLLGRKVTFFCPHKKHRKPNPIKCAVSRGAIASTGASARRVDIKTALTPGQHCTWDSSSTGGKGAESGATQDCTRLRRDTNRRCQRIRQASRAPRRGDHEELRRGERTNTRIHDDERNPT